MPSGNSLQFLAPHQAHTIGIKNRILLVDGQNLPADRGIKLVTPGQFLRIDIV